MKDSHGDKISVTTSRMKVFLSCETDEHELTDAELTPAKARKLAKKLLKPADQIEAGQ